MSRSLRQAMIISLINKNDITTQDDLVAELKASGFNATQATVSRDIKELNLVKTMTGNGVYKYTTYSDSTSVASVKTMALMRSMILSNISNGNLVILRTVPNCGSALCDMIEQMSIADTLGVVFGTQTTTIICVDESTATKVSNNISELII